MYTGRVHVSVDRVYCEEATIEVRSTDDDDESPSATGQNVVDQQQPQQQQQTHHSQLNVDTGNAYVGIGTDAEDGTAFLYAGRETLPFRGCMYHVTVNR